MNDTEQLIQQARDAHARAMKCSEIAHEGGWVARAGYYDWPASNYWAVTATRAPTKAGVEPYTVSKALVTDPDVAALLTFISTALPQLCDLASRAQAAETRQRELEEALRDTLELVDDWVTVQWCARSTGERWKGAVERLRALLSPPTLEA